MTRQQLEQRNEAIHGEIMEAVAMRDEYQERIDSLSNERVANAKRINELLRQELEAIRG